MFHRDRHDSAVQAPCINVSDRTSPARVLVRDYILLLRFCAIDPISDDDSILKDSRSPESANRLAHRHWCDIHHPLRGLESATGGDLGEASCGTGECCAAKREGNTGGHGCEF
jgi:hypothetical protein